MRHKLLAGLVLFFVIMGGVFGETSEFRDGYLLVRFNETGVSAAANTTRQAVVSAAVDGATIQKMYTLVPGLGLIKLPSGASVLTAKAAFRAAIGVQYAEPDYIQQIQAVPNDPSFGQLWGLNNTGQTGGTPDADIDAPEAWDIQKGSVQTIVAVIDSGVDYTHEDLNANMWVNAAEQNGQVGIDDDGNGYVDDIYGYDFANNDGDPMDDHYHGTHVSGTIGGVGNNGIGVVGVCWNVRIMGLKFLAADGNGSTAAAISAIQYATLMGARVLNNSWGGFGYSQALYDAISASRTAGVLFVAAAGNYGMDNDGALPAYPASYDLDNIVSVLATSNIDQRPSFSHWGKTSVDIGAPGVDIFSTFPGSTYSSISGTSMACPHVAGAAAIALSQNPQLTYLQVKQILLSTVDKLPSLKEQCVSEGRLNLFKVVQAANLGDSLPPMPDPMEWKVPPVSVGVQTIYMEAVTATDASSIEYFFKCIGNSAFDSEWQTSPIYYRGGYAASTLYQFQIQARDKSPKQNATQWSKIAEVGTPASDTLAPYPDPAIWKSLPRKVSNTRIGMEAAQGYDEFGTAVKYYFECTETTDPVYASNPGLLSKGPQTNPVCFVDGVSVASPGNVYTFRVRIEDHLGNVTGWSPAASVTLAPPPVTRNAPSLSYPTIQRAIDASNHGDTVVVAPGVHREININFKGKRITVRSQNPEDPAIVASTVIDCAEPQPLYVWETRRAFVFQNNETRESVLAGITIKNATAFDNATLTWGRDYTGPANGFLYDGTDAYGGAIYIGKKTPDPMSPNPMYPDYIEVYPASPTIRNCVFVDCFAHGQYGQDGPNAPDVSDDSPGAPGARGGDGGNAYGGAIFAVEGSSPLIKKCRFVNCQAVGGNAGNGGNGSGGGGHSDRFDEANGLRGGDGGDAGRGGCAWGGAIYFEPNCLPELYDVAVSNSFVKVGEAGRGGNGGNGSGAKSLGRGGHGGNGGLGGDLRAPDSSGGSIYFGENAQVVIEGSIFENCQVIAELAGNYSGGNGGNGGNAQGDGQIGGHGGHGGPAYFIPDKMREIGGVDAIGGTGGNGGNGSNGGARGNGGNGGFRLGLPGTGEVDGTDFDTEGHTGIFPSNTYYMAYYWEDTMNIDNPPLDPNDFQHYTYGWEWEPDINTVDVPYIPDATDPNTIETYTRISIGMDGIFDAPFFPYYGIMRYAEAYDPILTPVPVDPNDPDSLTILVPDYSNLVLVDSFTEVAQPLTPTNPDEPSAGACAGANYYGPNSVVTMKDTTISNNASFANHGGGELYDKGSQATFVDCRFEGNKTLYDTTALTDYVFEGYGGAVFADQPVGMSFTGCDFVGNQGKAGGAIYCNFAPSDIDIADPNMELTDCTFTENKADYHFMYSYGGAVYAGNSLDPYEEYYFNFLMTHRVSSFWDYMSLYFPFYPAPNWRYYPTDTYYEFLTFVTSVYDHYHGAAKFFNPIGTALWVDYLERDGIIVPVDTETERILQGPNAPRYQVPVTDCTFEGNLSPYGAAFYTDASIVDVTNSQFVENLGQTGVGLYSYVCDLQVQDSEFDKNVGEGIPTLGALSQEESSTVIAYGFGGGVYVAGSDLLMLNNRFTANTVSGYAGAVYISGLSVAGSPQTLVNNLFVENEAELAGGAMVATSYSDVDMVNSTFVDNEVSDLGAGVAGAVLVHDTFMSVRNSIFRDNRATLGSQIAVGNPLDDPEYAPFSTLWFYNSDVQGGEEDIFIDYNGSPWLIYEETNIEDDPATVLVDESDPLFARVDEPNEALGRTFYLSQIEAGQLATSPCVDTGYNVDTVAWLSEMLGFEITTRTDHVADTEPLNMGFYYNTSLLDPDFPVKDYLLTASVYVADYYPHGKLKLTIMGDTVEVGKDPYLVTLKQGVQVLLTAEPDAKFRVKRWIGTDDDKSVELINTVTMTGNKLVQVEFERDVPKRLFVPEGYTTIEDAIAASRSKDTIVLAPRSGQPYTITDPEGINFGGRQLTLTSTDPNDAYIVANTVIDAEGSRYISKRAFHFNNGEDPNTLIEGITIRNAFTAGAIGLSGAILEEEFPPGQSPPAPNRANSGMDATGNGYGGAILCTEGSSPTIRKVVFENCTVSGGIGGDGVNGYTQNTQGMTGDRDGQSGGHAGYGYGNGYGGAIAVVEGSSPTITLCTFRNNRATGGWGGIPGHGGHAIGNGRYSWGGYAGDGEGDGRGGAIYIEAGCNPLVTDNIFEGNYARLGYVSSGGRAGTGAEYPDPWDIPIGHWTPEARAGRDGMLYSYGTVAGGAIFYGEEADSYINNSIFENNQAYLPLPMNIQLDYYTIPADVYDYTRGGAIFADPNVTLLINRCQFTDNLGGAVYAETGAKLTVSNSRFEGNATYDPNEGKTGIYNLEAYFMPDLEEQPDQPSGAITVKANSETATEIVNCEFVGNLSDGSGGALYTQSDINVSDSLFSTNDAVLRGGAIFSYRHIPDPNTDTLLVNLQNCEFTYNSSDELGGAMYAKNCYIAGNDENEFGVQNCQFVGNKAPSGGGLLAVESDLTISNGLFVANQATGLAPTFGMVTDTLTEIMYYSLYYSIYEDGVVTASNHQSVLDEGVGGGLYLVDTKTAISNTRILDNTANGVNAAGGGLCINGGVDGVTTHDLKNCLIAGNSAQKNGGGMKLMIYANPQFANCTIVDNTAGNLGGGMFLDTSSKATIVNSILAGNSPTDTYEQKAGSVSVAPVFGGSPMFVTGPLGKYYLSPSSPAVNGGNKTAAEAGMNTFTTNPAVPVILDSGQVDLGYHHDDPTFLAKFALTVTVQDNRGTVTQLPLPFGGRYYYGQIVDLMATINTDYVITGWSGGTVNDDSTATSNSVVINYNNAVPVFKENGTVDYYKKAIVVKVRQRDTYYVGGSTGLPDLQRAIDAAQDGDQILVYPGTISPPVGTDDSSFLGYYRIINLDGKALRISGMNPDDENTVRNTVFSEYAFILSNATEDTWIEGITIQMSVSAGGSVSAMAILNGNPIIRNVIFRDCRQTGAVQSKVLNCNNSVMDGSNVASMHGGAVSILEGAPKFINCKFEDNGVFGSVAMNGANGCAAHPDGGEGGWPGRAYGGAVYAAFSSKPTFESCTFTGNQAFGGVGGNGGNGATIDNVWYYGGRGGGYLWPESIENDVQNYWFWFDGWEEGDKYWYYADFFGRYDYDVWANWFGWDKWNSWEEFFASSEYQISYSLSPKVDGYEEYWKYSGFGGAVYVGYLSEATFTDCTFEGNETRGSRSGVGGLSGNGRYPTPNRQLNLPNAGGAVYAAYDSKLVFDNCRFSGNVADTSTVEVPITYEVSFGGAVAYEFGCDVEFVNSDFEGNRSAVGGGIYGRESAVEIADCNAFDNEAFLGAGLYFDQGSALITNTMVHANTATTPAVVIVPPVEGEEEPPLPVPTIDATGLGGGLLAASADLNLRHSVFVKNTADISGGGLLLTGTVPTQSEVFNTLFAHNEAGRDGGGASVNWESRAAFGNCTFGNNKVNGYGSGDLYNPGTGGGLYCAYNSIVDVIDSIFWGNQAAQGSQITVGTGFEFDPRPSTLNITYADVQNYGSASAIFRGQGCIVNPSVPVGMRASNPLFETLPDTAVTDVRYQYYLQAESPLIDKGSTMASDPTIGLSGYTTSIFGGRDRVEVDLGYHYSTIFKSPCSTTDLMLSGRIDLADFAELASAWLMGSCGAGNGWCGGADLNFDREVNVYDLFSFGQCWLETDKEAPFPSPSVWAMEPNAVPGSFTEIIMQIGETHDEWWPDANIKYYFECLNDPTRSSGWIKVPIYRIAGLLPGSGYTFTARARDGFGNVTLPSPEVTEKPGETTKPTPNPAQWLRPPFVLTSTSVRMEAAAYNGPTLPAGVTVEYFFDYIGNFAGGDDSDWQTSPIYTDTGLTTGLTYEYLVRMRFTTATFGPYEPGQDSVTESVLVVPVDLEAPTPNPAEFMPNSPFQLKVSEIYYHIMVAVEAVDDSGVEYRFVCVDEPGLSSGWRNAANVAGTFYPNGTAQVPQQYWAAVGVKNLLYSWTVQYRDQAPAQTAGVASPAKQVGTLP